MEPARVTSAVDIDDDVGERWWNGGPTVVYDGLGLESESSPIELWHSCRSCRARAVRFDVREVLAPGRQLVAEGGARWVSQLAKAFGLETSHLLERPSFVTSSGSTPHFLRSDCTRCGAQHGAVLGYGEHQPARYIATVEGVGLVETAPDDPAPGEPRPEEHSPGEPMPDERISPLAAIVAVLAVLAVAGLVVCFNYSAVRDWRLASLLERSGVVTEATVTGERESRGPRSPDQFWLTVRFVVDDTTYEDERPVDAAAHHVATIADRTEVVYLPTDPSRFDVLGNDNHLVRAAAVAIIDLLLVVAGAAVARQAPQAGQVEST